MFAVRCDYTRKVKNGVGWWVLNILWLRHVTGTGNSLIQKRLSIPTVMHRCADWPTAILHCYLDDKGTNTASAQIILPVLAARRASRFYPVNSWLGCVDDLWSLTNHSRLISLAISSSLLRPPLPGQVRSKHCDKHICLSVRSHISKTTWPNFDENLINIQITGQRNGR